MRTRDRIKAIAIEQFNEYGATNMSTIRLSNCLNISPGNFYYYFASKEELVRAIWNEDMLPKSDYLFHDDSYTDDAAGLLSFIEDCINHVYDFRFFYTELFILQKNDLDLRDIYQKRFKTLVAKVAYLFTQWEKTAIITVDPSPGNRAISLENIWANIMAWTGFSSAYNHKSSAKQVRKKILLHVFNAFHLILSQKGHDQLVPLLIKKGVIKE